MIVLDTHVLLWWGNGNGSLSPQAAAAIQAERDRDAGRILVSSITAWEIAMLVEKGRLDLTTDVNTWLSTLNELPQVEFVPVNNGIATHSVTLPGEFDKDPADRIIVATARLASAALVSADAKIQAYPHVRTVW